MVDGGDQIEIIGRHRAPMGGKENNTM